MNKLEKNFVVGEEHTAARVASGALAVLATPVMIAWMENTAMTLAGDYTTEDETTVGIEINTRHMKASAVGEKIKCTAVLERQDGRKLSFSIVCKNEREDVIGESTHDRFIVNEAKFMSKL